MRKNHPFYQAVTGLCIAAMSVSLLSGTAVSAKKSNVRLNKTKLTMTQGKTFKLKVTGIKKAKLSFKSSAPSVAAVNASGRITAKKKGKATITVTIKKAAKKYKKTCKVTVKAASKAPVQTQTPQATQPAAPAPTAAATVVPTTAPTDNAIPSATVLPTATPTEAPTATPEPTITPRPTQGPDYQTFAPEIKKVTENNPLISNSYTADPAVLEYNGRL